MDWSKQDGTAVAEVAAATPDFYMMAPIRVRAKMDGDGRRVKAVDDEGRLQITSLASTPDIDEHNEIVEATAFASSIAKFGEIPIMLAYHDMRQPVGLWPTQKLSNAGLLLEGFVSSGRPDIQQLVLDGVLAHTSIGFLVKDVEWDDDLEVLRIKDLELAEVSLVPRPANRSTWVSLDGWQARATKEWRTKHAPQAPTVVTVEKEEDGRIACQMDPEIVTGFMEAAGLMGRAMAGVAKAIAR